MHADPELEADVFEELDEDLATRLLGARTDAEISSYAGLIMTRWPFSLMPTEPRSRILAPQSMPGMCDRP